MTIDEITAAEVQSNKHGIEILDCNWLSAWTEDLVQLYVDSMDCGYFELN